MGHNFGIKVFELLNPKNKGIPEECAERYFCESCSERDGYVSCFG
jgi:hypothetical protein